ncbi:Zn-dependent hydrolase [Lentibacillus lipolyticus]|nr:Zn-dependent hydrolase [Lentibacillus lipolyticus]
MDKLKTWIERNLCKLNNVEKMDDPHGFTRLGFTKEEAKSHHQFLAIAKELELKTYRDQAGNHWAVWEVDKDAPTIAMGSHLDTVYNGGGYDGVAGVLCALATIKMLKDKHFQPQKNMAVICFVSEESARFGVSTIGSKAVSGELDFKELIGVTDKNGITVKQAVEDMGVHWEELEQATLPSHELEQFLEVHIEQGDKLQESNAQIGVVTGIARPTRLIVTTHGTSNHTGTTPMHKRNDALVAIAPLISYVQEATLKINQQEDPHLVATVSTVNAKPNAMTSIPGEVQIGIDIRSINDGAKQKLVEKITNYCRQIEEQNSVHVQIQTLVDNKPVKLDQTIHNKLFRASHHLSFKTESMVSGAGHDAMNMATRWPTGLVFIPCRDGISHQPQEYTEVQNMVNATMVLSEYLQSEALHYSNSNLNREE